MKKSKKPRLPKISTGPAYPRDIRIGRPPGYHARIVVPDLPPRRRPAGEVVRFPRRS